MDQDTTYLVFEEPIYEETVKTSPFNEAAIDPRTISTGKNSELTARNTYDWRVWSAAGFGKRLRSALSGTGYSCEVLDAGKYLSCRVSYSDTGSGRTISKTFVIVFHSRKNGNGTVFTNSVRWRTISSVEQAASYIKSYVSALTGITTSMN